MIQKQKANLLIKTLLLLEEYSQFYLIGEMNNKAKQSEHLKKEMDAIN